MQYKNKAKHINIKDGILLLAKKFDLTLSEKKVIYYVAAGLSVKSCSNLLDRNIKTISTQKRSAYNPGTVRAQTHCQRRAAHYARTGDGHPGGNRGQDA